MARVKLTARKHVHAPPHRNVVPTESHSNGQDIGYILRRSFWPGWTARRWLSGGWWWQAELADGGARSRGKGSYGEAKWRWGSLPLSAGTGIRPMPMWVSGSDRRRGLTARWRSDWVGAGPVPGASVKKVMGCWHVDPVHFKLFSDFHNQFKIVNSKPVPSLGPKLFKLFMRLPLNIRNNFLNWFNLKILTEFML
jgi:hypothetical protein